MWISLSIGNAWLMVLYTREYYARTAGPAANPAGDPWESLGIYDFFVPRTLRFQYPEWFFTPEQLLANEVALTARKAKKFPFAFKF